MNRPFINAQLLVAVISLSLAGIIGLQAYLFRSAIMVRDARFKAEAAEALQAVSHRLEAIEAHKILAGKFDDFGISTSPSVVFTDSVLIINGRGSAISGVRDTFYFQQELPRARQYEMGMDTSGTSERVNRELSMRFAAQKVRYRKYLEARMMRMDTVVRQMMLQSITGNVPISEKFSKPEIDSLIAAELRQKGLELDFEYGIVEDGFVSTLRSTNFQPDRADFKVALYKNNFFSGPKFLLITFPERVSYLLKNLWYMLALSGLFTTMIIIAFGYTMNQMQKQKKISEIKSDFINNMTHEFKTPIATINLAVDALASEKVKQDASRMEHYRKVIREENRRMHAQVEKVLQLALLDKQELELRQVEIDINKLIEASASHMALQVEERNGTLNLKLEAAPCLVKGDELHLGNVFVNLLDNALKYSAERPEIEVTTSATGNRLFVAVRDNGPGMSKEVQRKIFDRFYRQEGGNIHNVKGHGLGLSYVRAIIEMHGGLIMVDSLPGEGTTFTVELPLATINHHEQQSIIS